MLVSECLRHGCNVFQLAEFYYCDNLPLARVFSAHIGNACARLQCLARCCRCGTGRQHRALKDTVVLRSVVQHCAAYSGVSVQKLLGRFGPVFLAGQCPWVEYGGRALAKSRWQAPSPDRQPSKFVGADCYYSRTRAERGVNRQYHRGGLRVTDCCRFLQ